MQLVVRQAEAEVLVEEVGRGLTDGGGHDLDDPEVDRDLGHLAQHPRHRGGGGRRLAAVVRVDGHRYSVLVLVLVELSGKPIRGVAVTGPSAARVEACGREDRRLAANGRRDDRADDLRPGSPRHPSAEGGGSNTPVRTVTSMLASAHAQGAAEGEPATEHTCSRRTPPSCRASADGGDEVERPPALREAEPDRQARRRRAQRDREGELDRASPPSRRPRGWNRRSCDSRRDR